MNKTPPGKRKRRGHCGEGNDLKKGLEREEEFLL